MPALSIRHAVVAIVVSLLATSVVATPPAALERRLNCCLRTECPSECGSHVGLSFGYPYMYPTTNCADSMKVLALLGVLINHYGKGLVAHLMDYTVRRDTLAGFVYKYS